MRQHCSSKRRLSAIWDTFAHCWKGWYRTIRKRLVGCDILPERERRQVLYEWNETEVEYPRERCIHELFEEQVREDAGCGGGSV